MSVTEIVVSATIAVVGGTLFVLMVWAGARDNRRREAELVRQWESALARTRGSDTRLVFVRSRYQTAKTGSKADVYDFPNGRRQDTWFEGWTVPAGVYLLVRGSTGWGPHNHNPNVLYVDRRNVLEVISGDAPDAWRRHRERASDTAP